MIINCCSKGKQSHPSVLWLMTGIYDEFIELHNTVIEDDYLNLMITFKDKIAMVQLIS